MAGLRERQKVDRSRRILAAAVERFQRDGFREARIEDVAGDAEVSPGTVYNYFPNKGDLLMATVSLEVEEVLAAGAVVVADPPPGAEAALMTLIGAYYSHSLTYLSKEMWRAAMALSIEAPHTPNGERYAALDARLAAQVTELIARLQARGEVAAGLDACVLGEVVFNNLNQMFVAFVREETMTLDTLMARVAAQAGPLAQLMAPGARPA